MHTGNQYAFQSVKFFLVAVAFTMVVFVVVVFAMTLFLVIIIVVILFVVLLLIFSRPGVAKAVLQTPL